MGAITIRPKTSSDQADIRAELIRHWESTQIWSVGRAFEADQIPALVAEIDGSFAGLATYDLHPGAYQCELITLSSRTPNKGVGAALLRAVEAEATKAGCARVFLTTTNDNTDAMRFYQRQGWDMCALHRRMVDVVRETRKPGMPAVGNHQIPIRHEIEFEKLLRGVHRTGQIGRD